MKKPEITPGEWYHTNDGVFTDSGGRSNVVAEWTLVNDGKAISAVPDMIDALIGARKCVGDKSPFEQATFKKVEQALIKAGVEL